MKTLRDLISESESKKITLCDLLSRKSPVEFNDFMVSDETMVISRWINGATNAAERKDLDKKIIDSIVNCKTRENWTKSAGVPLHRGLIRKASDIKSMGVVLSPDIKTMGNGMWVTGKGKYKSNYTAQSWTDKFNIAAKFSGGLMFRAAGGGDSIRAGYSIWMVLTMAPPNPNDTFVIPNQWSFLGEREVVFFNNKTVDVEVSLDLSRLVESMWEGRGKSISLQSMADVVGMNNAKTLMNSKQFKDAVEYDWDSVQWIDRQSARRRFQ